MAAKEQMKNDNTPVMKRQRKGPEEKARLDSTKHLYYDGPNQKGMTKPLKPIPVFKQVNSKLCFAPGVNKKPKKSKLSGMDFGLS